MKKLHIALSLILSLCFIFAGCDLDIEDETVSASGDLTYYAEMDEDTLEKKCKGNYIEVSGAVHIVYQNIGKIYLGNRLSDKIQFSCDLSNSDDTVNIEEGDLVTVHGECSSCIGSTVYLRNCKVKKQTNQNEAESTAPTSEATSTPTIEPTTAPTNEPSHTHKYKAATCTKPKTCSCGATDGKATGHSWKAATCKAPKTCKTCGTTTGNVADHSWKAATCKAPKTCKSCGATEGTTKEHSWKSATYSSPKKCSNCGKTEGSTLEKPGKENYHGHVYTGGSSSTKFHYEEKCPGKYSHEITWKDIDKLGLKPCGTCVLK